MGRRISMATRREILNATRQRYAGKSRREKSRILDEFVAVTGYHRKHALRLLNQAEDQPGEPKRIGRRIYDEAVRAALIVVWETADRICGKRLKAALPSLVESMERHGHLRLDDEVRRRLLAVSASTIDRLLAPVRDEAGRRRRCGGVVSAIRKKVPVRTFGDWDDPSPGYFEGDLVAHCGGSMAGSFVHTFTLTDIASGWTEGLPLLVREQGLVTEALDAFRARLPVALRGLDTDNDSVFMNEILLEYCERHGIELTRSRAYRKNDQAWVEQKNGSVVRRLVGYDRFAGVAAAQVLARLFEVARLYVNFFQPSFKLRDKTRDGAKVTRRYFKPATPCERLLAHPAVSEQTKERLRRLRVDLDPVELLKKLREAQAELARLTFAGSREVSADPSLESFLAQLPELWRRGECRPTHRQRPPRVRAWRTRADPFEAVWTEAQGWLEQEPDITGKALFERLRGKYPGEFAPGQLRTLQRRVREWRQAMARQLIAISSPMTEASPAPSVSRFAQPSAPLRRARSPHAPPGERGLHDRETAHP
jgi:hypothetical protein